MRKIVPAWIACALLVLVLSVFQEVRHHDFVNLDDGIYVVRNEALDEGLSSERVVD